jgi:hypothetical protein
MEPMHSNSSVQSHPSCWILPHGLEFDVQVAPRPSPPRLRFALVSLATACVALLLHASSTKIPLVMEILSTAEREPSIPPEPLHILVPEASPLAREAETTLASVHVVKPDRGTEPKPRAPRTGTSQTSKRKARTMDAWHDERSEQVRRDCTDYAGKDELVVVWYAIREHRVTDVTVRNSTISAAARCVEDLLRSHIRRGWSTSSTAESAHEARFYITP